MGNTLHSTREEQRDRMETKRRLPNKLHYTRAVLQTANHESAWTYKLNNILESNTALTWHEWSKFAHLQLKTYP